MTTQDPLVVAEIRAHVADRVSASGLTVEETLQRLGTVHQFAKDYMSGALMKRARTRVRVTASLRSRLGRRYRTTRASNADLLMDECSAP